MRIAAIVVVVLLGLGLWWWSHGSGTGVAVPAPGAAVAAAPATDAAAADAAVPVATAPPAVSQPGPERSAVPEAATGGAPFVEVLVRVLDENTREPVAGAEVFWSDLTLVDLAKLSPAEIERGQRDEERFLQQHGRRTTSDGAGRAIIRPSGAYRLVGRLGSRYGHATGNTAEPPAGDDAYPGELLLLLGEDHTLVVRTVDEQRQPVGGVQVNVEHQRDGKPTGARQSLGSTDADGRLECAHAQLIGGRSRPDARALLCARITGAESARVAIDLRDVPREPVDIVVPACGTVEFTLLGFDGTPWPHTVGRANVTLTPDALRDAVPFGADGKAVFPLVRCGGQFVAQGRPWFEDHAFVGPARAGDVLQITLRIHGGLRMLTGRLLAGDGAPFAGVASMRFDEGAGGDNVFDRDGDGRFFVPVPSHVGDRPSIAIVARDQSRTAAREARVSVRGVLVPGRNDVSDVVLGEAPLLVAGELVGPDDNEPPAVRLELQRRDEGERSPWRPVGDLRVVLDAARRFVVRAPAGSTRWRLAVHGDCAPVTPIEFAPGTTDLRVPIDAPSWVVATFLPDPALELMTVRLAAANAERLEARARRGSAEAQLVAHGDRLQAEWRRLGAGPHRFVVECPGQDPVLELVVDVPRGARASDPRLTDIDLRGRARTVLVQLTHGDGAPFTGIADVIVRGRLDAGARWIGRRYGSNAADGLNLALSQPADLLVVAQGKRGTVVTGVFGDTRIPLAPAPKFTVAWIDAPALPAGVTAQLMWSVADWPPNGPLVHVGHARGSVTGTTILLGEGLPQRVTSGRAAGACGAVVPMRARLRLVRSGKMMQVVDVTPGVVDPAEVSDGQVIEVRADPAGMARALAALGG